MIVEQFIDLGWWTVPLRGEIRRDANGKKITSDIFESDWLNINSRTRNEKVTPLAGVLTGRQSDIIAIDCDDQNTYDAFTALDPSYEFHFGSIGKPAGGGTIIYKFDEDISTFKKSDALKLDVFAEGGMVFLPGENNFTKSWKHTTPPEVKPMPPTIRALLVELNKKAAVIRAEAGKNNRYSLRLNPLVKIFVDSKGEYNTQLFSKITPHEYRKGTKFEKNGSLHPKDVPGGSGSDYLMRVSGILGADISIDGNMYLSAMNYINNLWEPPMPAEKLRAEITQRMLDGKAVANGRPIWDYDPKWKDKGLILTSKNEEVIETFYDRKKQTHYLINYSDNTINAYAEKRRCISELKTLTGGKLTEEKFDAEQGLIKTTIDPSRDFGHFGWKEFNLFEAPEGLNVLKNPDSHAKEYRYPETTMNFFKSFIPDDDTRNYILSFVKTKLLHFEYSPVVLYFVGVPGSGKDTFVNILKDIIGPNQVDKPGALEFMGQFNAWMTDKYFVQLDEYGHSLNSANEHHALGVLKSVSGSEEVHIRPLRKEGFTYRHSITFIVTSNLNRALPIEPEDRRMALVVTPNKLEEQEWVKQLGSTKDMLDKMKEELLDFCCYLGNEVEELKGNAYTSAPNTAAKRKLIIDNMPAVERIVYNVGKKQFKDLAYLALDHGIKGFTRQWENSRLERDKLIELYTAITDGRGNDSVLTKAMQKAGCDCKRTTYYGNNIYVYFLSGLQQALVEITNEPKFKDMTAEKAKMEAEEKAAEAAKQVQAVPPQQDLNI